MRNLIILLVMIVIVSSCGKKIKLEHKVSAPENLNVNTTSDININRNFREVYDFCDERYGYMTEDSEECIDDILRMKVSVDTDLDDVILGCKESENEEACQNDIVDLLDKLPGLDLSGEEPDEVEDILSKGKGKGHGHGV